jgi:AcrR family transcriptional regulator
MLGPMSAPPGESDPPDGDGHSASHERRVRWRTEHEAPQPPDGRRKLLEATERLLAAAPLAELSVAKICAEAQISRGTLYLYFESKYEVVAELLSEVMDEMYGLLAPLADRGADGSRPALADAVREVLTASADLWQRHSAIFRATHENYIVVDELRDMWLAVTARFTDALLAGVGHEIDASDAERRRICASLTWTSEHLFYISSTGVDPALPGPRAAADVLARIWVSTISGPDAVD